MGRRVLHPLCTFDWDRLREDVVAYQARHEISTRSLQQTLGMSEGTLFGWLNGARRSVSGDTLASLAHVADLDLNTYIQGPLA